MRTIHLRLALVQRQSYRVDYCIKEPLRQKYEGKFLRSPQIKYPRYPYLYRKLMLSLSLAD